jgi:hypothetical protein
MVTRKTPAVRIALAAAFLVLALALVPAALAGKGGSGNTSGGSGATITFNPTTVTVGQQYTVSVSGFGAHAWAVVGAYFPYPTSTRWCSGWTDAAGNFSCTFTALQSGSILHVADKLDNNGRLSQVGSRTLTISP